MLGQTGSVRINPISVSFVIEYFRVLLLIITLSCVIRFISYLLLIVDDKLNLLYEEYS